MMHRFKSVLANRQVTHALGVGARSFAVLLLMAATMSVSAADETSEAPVTAAAKLSTLPDFQAERLYVVPSGEQGSWVAMCTDPRGRLIVSDQYGDLYRVTVPAKGQPGKTTVKKLPIELGESQGLLWAFDSLYVMVNGEDDNYINGLYRVRDTDGDDQLDSVTLLRELKGKGEHGPHAILLSPDGKSLFVICGNHTQITEITFSRVPHIDDADNRLPLATPAAEACVYHIDPDGKNWELFSSGLRNPYDNAFNADGELFTFDADEEPDVGAPWYRPTRVCHIVSGADWGFRRGDAPWRASFPDSLPTIEVGLGSPTGITFGYGAHFPEKYQRALYLCDWSQGLMLAMHLEPSGSSYRGTFEHFVSGAPLPLTDVVINPTDGAMYFITGGRGTQSALYRVTYDQEEPAATQTVADTTADARKLRHQLEAFHSANAASAVDQAWPYLRDNDPFLRHAARTILEHAPIDVWKERMLTESDPTTLLTAALACVRSLPADDPDDKTGSAEPTSGGDSLSDSARQFAAVADALDGLEWKSLTREQQLALLRIYQIGLYRFDLADGLHDRLVAKIDVVYPARDLDIDSIATELMCHLDAPTAAEKGVQLLKSARTQEAQIDIARSLCKLDSGWTPALRTDFWKWLVHSRSYKGGANFSSLVQDIRQEAVERASDEEQSALEKLEAEADARIQEAVATQRPFVKEWTLEELSALLNSDLSGRDVARGRQLFVAANCANCHRIANEGTSVGPDLTSLAGRFAPREILESIVDPNKVISDQYAAIAILTTSGKFISGRIVDQYGDALVVNTNMLDPSHKSSVRVAPDEIEEITTSKVSMMPSGLLNTLDQDEVLDLLAYLLSSPARTSAIPNRGSSLSNGQ